MIAHRLWLVMFTASCVFGIWAGYVEHFPLLMGIAALDLVVVPLTEWLRHKRGHR